MPWTVNDVDRHYKGLTDKQKRQWVHVANGALERGDEDGVAIRKANGAVNNSKVESVLYKLAGEHIAAVQMQEAAAFFDGFLLNEADPKPRVETDINGDPVVPTKDQFDSYFDAMTAAHIDTALNTTRKRWEDAAKNPKGDQAKAELEALENELKAGEEALEKKNSTSLDAMNGAAEEVFARQEELRNIVQHVARCVMQDLISPK